MSSGSRGASGDLFSRARDVPCNFHSVTAAGTTTGASDQLETGVPATGHLLRRFAQTGAKASMTTWTISAHKASQPPLADRFDYDPAEGFAPELDPGERVAQEGALREVGFHMDADQPDRPDQLAAHDLSRTSSADGLRLLDYTTVTSTPAGHGRDLQGGEGA
jgi:hypothetical protein